MFAHTFLFPGSGPSHICWYFCWYWIDIWRIFAWYLFHSLDWDFAWFFADIFVLSLWPILTCNSCLPQYGTRACLDSGKRIWCYRFGFWYWVLNIDYWILTLITLNIKILTRLSISTVKINLLKISIKDSYIILGPHLACESEEFDICFCYFSSSPFLLIFDNFEEFSFALQCISSQFILVTEGQVLTPSYFYGRTPNVSFS